MISHKEIVAIKSDYAYLNELEIVADRVLVKYEQNTEDGVGETTPKNPKVSKMKVSENDSEMPPATPRAGKTLEIGTKRGSKGSFRGHGRGWHMKVRAEERRMQKDPGNTNHQPAPVVIKKQTTLNVGTTDDKLSITENQAPIYSGRGNFYADLSFLGTRKAANVANTKFVEITKASRRGRQPAIKKEEGSSPKEKKAGKDDETEDEEEY